MKTTKVCRDCKVEKERPDFVSSKRYVDGMHCYCKQCMLRRTKAWQAANREKVRQARAIAYRKEADALGRKPQRKWTPEELENKASIKQEQKRLKQAEWAANNKLRRKIKAREAVLKRRGLTREEYQKALEDQHGVCAICQKVNANGIHLAVDHDHGCAHARNSSCSKCFRGLLCVHCNTAIHKMEADPSWHLRAAAYLIQFKEKQHE